MHRRDNSTRPADGASATSGPSCSLCGTAGAERLDQPAVPSADVPSQWLCLVCTTVFNGTEDEWKRNWPARKLRNRPMGSLTAAEEDALSSWWRTRGQH